MFRSEIAPEHAPEQLQTAPLQRFEPLFFHLFRCSGTSRVHIHFLKELYTGRYIRAILYIECTINRNTGTNGLSTWSEARHINVCSCSGVCSGRKSLRNKPEHEKREKGLQTAPHQRLRLVPERNRSGTTPEQTKAALSPALLVSPPGREEGSRGAGTCSIYETVS